MLKKSFMTHKLADSPKSISSTDAMRSSLFALCHTWAHCWCPPMMQHSIYNVAIEQQPLKFPKTIFILTFVLCMMNWSSQHENCHCWQNQRWSIYEQSNTAYWNKSDIKQKQTHLKKTCQNTCTQTTSDAEAFLLRFPSSLAEQPLTQSLYTLM